MLIQTPVEVAVLIVNYKTSHLIPGLVKTISREHVGLKIVIVDNESSDDSLKSLNAIEDPRIIVLESKGNLGFTGGVNFGVSYIVENLPSAKYLFLLNPDAYSSPGLITSLIKVLVSDSRIACVSPRIRDLRGVTWYSGAYIRYDIGTVVVTAENQTDENVLKEIDVFSGCAVLFDLSKFIEAGMFNVNLFMYYDEADLAIRLRFLGYKIVYEPAFTISHDVSYTTRNISHLKTYYMTRNKFIVFSKEMKRSYKLYFLLHELAYHIKCGRVKNALYHMKGYFDFLVGRRGACA